MKTTTPTVRHQWPLYVLTVLLLLGTGIGGYLTWHHENELYGDSGVSLANCPENAIINCEVVNTSKYSEMFGIPIAALAIPTYLLLLALILWRRRQFQAVVAIFYIGLLTTLYSGYLYYVSSVKVGYLCLWCMRLYAINLAIPVLSAIALGPSARYLRTAFGPLFRWKTGPAKFATQVFAGLFALTLLMQQGYRATLSKAKPTAAAAAAGAGAADWAPGRFRVPAKLALLEATTNSDGAADVKETDFDLQTRFGTGKPVALFFHSPGYTYSDTQLVETEKFLRTEAPQIEFYVVAAKRAEARIQATWEALRLIGLPLETKVLVDEGAEAQKALGIQETPNLTLVGGDGTLIALRLRDLRAAVPSAGGRTSQDILRATARGTQKSQFKITPQYFPSSELIGQCAPSFALNDLMTGKTTRFTGKSANGKPTLLVFWSSTCKHCQKEIPAIVESLKSKRAKYNVVSVSMIKPDRSDGTSHRNITKAYIKNTGIAFPVLVDSGRVSNMYGVTSTPTSFVIGANGEVTESWYFVHSNFEEALDKALAKAGQTSGSCKPSSFANYSKLDFNVVSAAGKKMSLGQITRKPSLVHLWATWCIPCQEELPALLAFSQKLERAQGKLTLVSVEGESSGPEIASFLKNYGKNVESYRYPHDGLVKHANLAYQVPRTYVVDGDGRVLTTLSGAQKWDDPAFQERVLAWLQVGAPARDLSSHK